MNQARKAIFAILISGALFGSIGAGSALAVHGNPDKDKKVTLTILITQHGISGGWGKVSYKGGATGACAFVSCGMRVKKGTVLHFTETAVDVKHHPFIEWILPSGQTAKGGKLTLTIKAQEALQAKYKA